MVCGIHFSLRNLKKQNRCHPTEFLSPEYFCINLTDWTEYNCVHCKREQRLENSALQNKKGVTAITALLLGKAELHTFFPFLMDSARGKRRNAKPSACINPTTDNGKRAKCTELPVLTVIRYSLLGQDKWDVLIRSVNLHGVMPIKHKTFV